MDEWGISGNYKKLEAIFIEYEHILGARYTN